jgi:hypothetical protein
MKPKTKLQDEEPDIVAGGCIVEQPNLLDMGRSPYDDSHPEAGLNVCHMAQMLQPGMPRDWELMHTGTFHAALKEVGGQPGDPERVAIVERRHAAFAEWVRERVAVGAWPE